MNLLERFAQTLAPSESQILGDVQEYIAWQTDRRASVQNKHEPASVDTFVPTADDDVDLRTFFLHLRTNGTDREHLQQARASLRRFYGWAKADGLIASNPFDEFDFARPFLTREQIRRRQETTTGDPQAREMERLRALNQVAEQLNRSADVQTALDATLETLCQMMDVQSAWVFILTESGIQSFTRGNAAHDFVLAAARGLPPGLEQKEAHFLRKPPDCHCQSFFRNGRLARAVNIVECTRLQEAEAAQGDNQGLLFHASVPLVSQGSLLGIINVATYEWQFLSASDLQFLTNVGAQVAVALERAQLYDLAEAHRKHLEHELQVAHQVQASLLPRELPDLPGFRLAADWRSAHQVAGDFYDLFPLHEGRWGLVVGDVSDKGAPAALYMAMSRALIRANAPRHHTPASTLMYLNETVLAQSSYDMFLTVFYGVLDPETRMLTYANAGHNPPLVRRASGEIERLPRTGRFIGTLDNLHLTDAEVMLAPGDALVIYTDGVTDALNPSGQDYGQERLMAALRNEHASAPELLDHLRADLAAFTQGAPQPDDITLFVLTSE